jgi:hypothetical protein
MNALSLSLSLSVKKNQCRKISHTQSRSHTDFAPPSGLEPETL